MSNTFRCQFRLNGLRMKASGYMTKEGGWKIFSIGAVDIPTVLLPFEAQCEAMELVRLPPFPSKGAAVGHLKGLGQP